MEGDSKAEAIWATCQVFAFDARKVFRARITNGHEVAKWPVRDGLNGALRNRARRPVRPDVYKEGMVGTSVVLGMCPQSGTPAGLSELLPPSEKLQWADSSQGAGQISTCLTSQHLGLEARSRQEFKNSLRYMASLRGQGYMGPKS